MGPKALGHKILSVTGLIKVLGQISVAYSGGKKGGKIAAHPRGGPAGLVTRQASSSQPLRRLTAKSLTFLEPSGKEHTPDGSLPEDPAATWAAPPRTAGCSKIPGLAGRARQ